MPLETATHISQLVATNPAHSDGLNQADSHIRLIKQVLLNDIGAAFSGGNLTTPDGTKTAPAIGFAADATAGFYRVGTGETGIAGRLVGQGAVPIGSLIDFAGPDANIPAGYLPCDGTAVSRTTYPELFTAISTTWGAGDGSTTFNLPNLIYRFRRHRDNSTVSGATGNLQSPANMAHTHTFGGNTGSDSVDHSHTFSGATGTMNSNQSHTHASNAAANTGGSGTGGGGFSINAPGAATITATNTDHTHNFSGTTSVESNVHSHAYSGTTSGGSADSATEARPYSGTVLTIIRVL